MSTIPHLKAPNCDFLNPPPDFVPKRPPDGHKGDYSRLRTKVVFELPFPRVQGFMPSVPMQYLSDWIKKNLDVLENLTPKEHLEAFHRHAMESEEGSVARQAWAELEQAQQKGF